MSRSVRGNLAWEDDTHYVYVGVDTEVARPKEYLIRCQAVTGRCQRTTPALHGRVTMAVQ